MIANSTGCTTSTRSIPGASGVPRRTSVNDQSTNSAKASAHASICRANTGAVSSNSMPMPNHWEPWPGNTKTFLPAGAAVPRTTAPSLPSPAARSSSPASSRARSPPTTTARCSKVARPANDQPTSAMSTSGCAPTCSANRAAWDCSPVADLADTTHGTTGTVAPPVAPCSAGASSTITCALVPLIPNDETPALLTRSPAGHGCASVNSDTEPADQSTCGLGASTCNVAGAVPCRIACTILMTPATPAAACV